MVARDLAQEEDGERERGEEEAALALLLRGLVARLGAGLPRFDEAVAPAADAEEAAALAALREEEAEAMAAILGGECEAAGGGCLVLTLLYDPHTGEAPWAFSAQHAAPVCGS